MFEVTDESGLIWKGESDGYPAAATTATEETQALPADAVEACPHFFRSDMLTWLCNMQGSLN